MLPDGLIRTPMGVFVLRDDVFLSRVVEREHRLDMRDNIIEISSFAHLIPEGGVVIDAGAFLGDHTISYSQIVGPLGFVYALEPHPLTFEALGRNIERLNNVVAYRVGLSDVQGTAQFSQDPNAGGSFMSDSGPVTVDVTTLDSLFSMALRCDFIHLDAEGYEPRILQGARELIARFHPLMLIEVCDKHLRRAGSSETELVALIQGMGYKMATIPTHLEPELRDDLCTWGGA